MSKSKWLVALTAALVLALSGCSNTFDREWSSSVKHQGVASRDPADAEMTLEAENYDSLYEALRTFIAEGVEHGVVRIASYAGDLDADTAQAVLTVSNETPEGAYCVYYMNYNITRLVSVLEVSVSVIYRHSREELAAIDNCDGEADMENLMLDTLKGRLDFVTVRVTDENIDGDFISGAIEKAYYENPADILYIPTYTVNSYPEEGSERILEISLSYPYATSTVETRRAALGRRTEEIAASAGEGTVNDRLMRLGEYLAANVTYDNSVDSSDIDARRYSAMTAYGALVQGSAVGEGYAMAVKVLCDRMGVECYVVRGRYNNMDYAWNTVRMDNGQLYHLDFSVFDPAGAVFKTDAQQLAANYWWDKAEYQACPGPSLYGPEFDPPVIVDPYPPVGP